MTLQEYEEFKRTQRYLFKHPELFPSDLLIKREQIYKFIVGLLYLAPPMRKEDVKRILGLVKTDSMVKKILKELEDGGYIYISEYDYVTTGKKANRYFTGRLLDASWCTPKISVTSSQTYSIRSGMLTQEIISKVALMLKEKFFSLTEKEQQDYIFDFFALNLFFGDFIEMSAEKRKYFIETNIDHPQKEEILSQYPIHQKASYNNGYRMAFLELVKSVRKLIESTDEYKRYHKKFTNYIHSPAGTIKVVELLRPLIPPDEITKGLIDWITPPKTMFVRYGNQALYEELLSRVEPDQRNSSLPNILRVYDKCMSLKQYLGSLNSKVGQEKVVLKISKAVQAYFDLHTEFIQNRNEWQQKVVTIGLLEENNVFIRKIDGGYIRIDCIDSMDDGKIFSHSTLRRKFELIGIFSTKLGLTPEITIRISDPSKYEELAKRSIQAFDKAKLMFRNMSLLSPKSVPKIKVVPMETYKNHTQIVKEFFENWNKGGRFYEN